MRQMDLKSITKEAERIAMSVDESVREAAYNRAFDFLVQQSNLGNAAPNKWHSPRDVSQSLGSSGSSVDEIATLMQIDRTAHKEVLNASSVLDRSLNVLRIANDEFQIDGLKAPQIAKILTEKFRLRTTRQAVQQALDNAGDKADRVPTEKGVVYRIMAPGETYLDNGDEQKSKKLVSPQPRRAKTANMQKSAEKREARKASTKGISSRKRNGRPGPKAALVELVSTGFFKTGKTISDIQSQLEEKQGYKYKSTDLSPALVRLLREAVIIRQKNSDGQYEYKS